MKHRVLTLTFGIAMLALGMGLARRGEAEGMRGAPSWPQDQDAMEAMMKAAAVTEHHKKLWTQVGNWTTESSLFMGPKVIKATGKATVEKVLGGRFIRFHDEGTMMGQPVEGIVYVGYDNLNSKYISLSMSTMATNWSTAAGVEEDGAINYKGTMYDAMTPKKGRPYRAVVTHEDADHMILDLYDTLPDGKEFKVMSVAYTRVK